MTSGLLEGLGHDSSGDSSGGEADDAPDVTTARHARGTPRLDVDAVLRDASVVVCCGAGGVGKTTTAAALALRAAELGRRTCVLTIDPARRLAQAMGLAELDNTPRRVDGIGADGGSLDAMMLDMKRTFDDLVARQADPDRVEAITANPFYESLSTSFSGTQEYMAMEKLVELRESGTYDLVVVDTPPTRSALDFLDAPERLGRFLDGRMLKVLLAPAKASGRFGFRLLSGGLSAVTSVMSRIVGAQALTDLQAFVGAFESMFGGFRERAERTYALLKEPSTAFVVVAAPEPDALREAAFFSDRLDDEAMPLAGVVLNRVHRPLAPLSARRALDAAERLDGGEAAALTAGALRVHAERAALAARERTLVAGFTRSRPHVAVGEVRALAREVSDLDGLRAVVAELLDDGAAGGSAEG